MKIPNLQLSRVQFPTPTSVPQRIPRVNGVSTPLWGPRNLGGNLPEKHLRAPTGCLCSGSGHLVKSMHCGYCTKVADLSPKNIFANYPPQMVPRDLNIGVSPGFGGLIQGQLYNPVVVLLVDNLGLLPKILQHPKMDP